MTAATGPLYVEVVVVTCACGQLPLDKAMHAHATDAWHAAAEHVTLNPDLCQPEMHRETVPAGLAPKPVRQHPTEMFTVLAPTPADEDDGYAVRTFYA